VNNKKEEKEDNDDYFLSEIERKKKYFEADDVLEFHKNKEKEELIDENSGNESNTINAKSSLSKKRRKINKNFFNRSKNPVDNKKDLKSSNRFKINNILISQNKSRFKNGVNNNNFQQQSKKLLPKEFFDYSRRKNNDKNKNNISSSKYKLLKEKAKTSLYLKRNSNTISKNNNDNIEFLTNNNQYLSKHNPNQLCAEPIRNIDPSIENQKIFLDKSNNFLNNIKNINRAKPNNNKYYILKSKILNNSDKNNLFFSNKDNNSLFYGSGSKIKRPTSCVNKNAEKIFYNNNNNKKNKELRFNNHGKKIYLKTDKRKNFINTINYNLKENLNNSNDAKDDKNSNENSINITKQFSPTINPSNYISASGNVITDIFFVKNLEGCNPKTTKGTTRFFLNNDKEDKQKRFPSAIKKKLIKDNSNNILL
jgi:hypothetical protein